MLAECTDRHTQATCKKSNAYVHGRCYKKAAACVQVRKKMGVFIASTVRPDHVVGNIMQLFYMAYFHGCIAMDMRMRSAEGSCLENLRKYYLAKFCYWCLTPNTQLALLA